MISERANDGIERRAAQWFKRYRTGVGGPRLVPLHVGQRQIDDFPGSIASLSRPAIEAGTKIRKSMG